MAGQPPSGETVLASDRETSIRRGIEVLLSLASEEAVAEGGMGVTRISEQLGREKSQVSRALKALAEYGLVERNRDALTYRLGWRVYTLAQVAARPRVVEEARPRLRALATALQERAHLSVLEGSQVLTVLTESPGRTLEAVGWAGRVTPAYCTSAGQALLLDHDDDELRGLLGEVAFVALAPNTPADLDGLRSRLDAARPGDVVVADEQFEAGLIAAAAPVRGPDGEIIAALNVSAPTFRFAGRVDELVQAVHAGARELTAALRAPDDEPPANGTLAGAAERG